VTGAGGRRTGAGPHADERQPQPPAQAGQNIKARVPAGPGLQRTHPVKIDQNRVVAIEPRADLDLQDGSVRICGRMPDGGDGLDPPPVISRPVFARSSVGSASIVNIDISIVAIISKFKQVLKKATLRKFAAITILNGL